MAVRSLQKSEAYAVLSEGGRKVLHVIDAEVRRGAVSISLDTLSELSGLCRSSVRCGIRLCETLGFLSVMLGPRRTNQFALSDGWRSVDEDEAKRLVKLARGPTPPRPTSSPPKPVKPVKVRVEVERPAPRQPSMPALQWLGR